MVNFILSGCARSGTTVIGGSLITHPEVRFYGELFNDVIGVRKNEAARLTLGAGWKIANAPTQPVRPCEQNESGRAYIEEFYAVERPAKAVGFKLLYDQALNGPNSDVWRYISDRSEIKIVRTQRENLLEIVCSYVRARITRRWHSPENIEKSPRFVLPPHECKSLFQRFEKTPSAFEDIEQTHRILDVEYTDISENFTTTMVRVFSFLGVDHAIEAKPHLRKIARLRPNEEIVNYPELQDHFQGTPYGRYFIF